MREAENSSSSSEDCSSSSTRKGGGVAYRTVLLRQSPREGTAGSNPVPSSNWKVPLNGRQLVSKTRGSALARAPGFDPSTFRHGTVPERSKGAACKAVIRGFESHPCLQCLSLLDY